VCVCVCVCNGTWSDVPTALLTVTHMIRDEKIMGIMSPEGLNFT